MRGRDAASVFHRYASATAAELAEATALRDELAAALEKTRAEQGEAALALAAVYLPELSKAGLAEAQRRTGFRGFDQRPPLEAFVREQRQLAARIAKAEADEHWVRREALVGPYGAYTRELAEARDLLEPWEKDCARFESLEGFLELVEIGYDTPAFAERWWQPSYWRHWRAGDNICEALGLPDFGDDVLPAYQKAVEPREKWRREVARIEQNIEAVHAHVRAHDEAVWRRDNLATIYLDECRGQLARHLVRADVPLLAGWAGDDRAVAIHLKRLAGLGAKVEMLEEMEQRWLAPTIGALGSNLRKFQVKAAKLDRPKKWGLDVAVPAGVEEKLDAQRTRRAKARDAIHRITRFDGYDRFDLGSPPETWYLHIHDNRRPGVFNPELRTWYDRHPDIVVITDPDVVETHAHSHSHHGGSDLGDIS